VAVPRDIDSGTDPASGNLAANEHILCRQINQKHVSTLAGQPEVAHIEIEGGPGRADHHPFRNDFERCLARPRAKEHTAWNQIRCHQLTPHYALSGPKLLSFRSMVLPFGLA
jgi:hypothetical protein